MSGSGLPFLPILSGPTASGKSSLALAVAEELGLEILNADSRQLFRGLEVATAAPDAGMRARVMHHLVGCVDPREEFSAGEFCRRSRELVCRPDGPGFLMAGGSVFYIRAFLDPVAEQIGATAELRAQVVELERREGPPGLRRELLARDPEAHWIALADSAKLRRYLEICLATGLPASRALRELRQPCPVRPALFVLDTPLAVLTRRIRARLHTMLDSGMVEEVRALLDAGIPETSQSLSSVGVADILEFIRGRIRRDELEERIFRNTRRYARKQLTWFRALVREGRARVLDHQLDEASLCRELCHTLRAEAGSGR